MRHRWRFIDSTLVVLLTAGVLYVGLAYDIFANAPGATVRSEALELDELLLVCGVLTVGAVWATSRLLRERRAHRARRAIEAEMRALAYSDALTGLPNRRQFDEALAAAAAAPPRAGGSHAVLMMDLNGFKRVNDAFGHGVGDELLMQVAARLRRIVREGDLAARLGGDEFAILSPHTAGPEAATGLALRVIEALEQPVLAGGVEHRIGAAVGLSLTPQDGADPEDLVRKADIALYRAKEDKHTKGSALRFFEPDMDAHVRERAVIERELTAAVAAGSVRPLFQPLVALGSHAVVGFEALPRWTSPVLGEVPPERFIAVAEDCGLIARLTDQLLEQACTAAATWPAHVELSFNVSGALLHDQDLRPAGSGHPGARPSGARTPRAGDHRKRPGARPRGRPRGARRLAQGGRAHRPGRLRHRLFQPLSPAKLRARQDQDRPQLRGRSWPLSRAAPPSCGRWWASDPASA